MKILFVHQNFPAQFSQIAAHLAKQTGNELLALKQPPSANFEGVGVVPYRFLHDTQTALHPLLGEMESKVLRGEAVAEAALRLRNKGWHPDVIIGHPGWGNYYLFVIFGLLQNWWCTANIITMQKVKILILILNFKIHAIPQWSG